MNGPNDKSKNEDKRAVSDGVEGVLSAVDTDEHGVEGEGDKGHATDAPVDAFLEAVEHDDDCGDTLESLNNDFEVPVTDIVS